MLKEISSLQGIFLETIESFGRLNMEWLKELVDLILETQGKHQSPSVTQSEINANFSPPRKPNLSPMPSAKRLNTSKDN
jgi:hypothetical protein